MKHFFRFLALWTLISAKPALGYENMVNSINIETDDRYVWGFNFKAAKVVITEVKAFDCPPCKRMDELITNPLKEHFKGRSDVLFVLKLGNVGTTGSSAVMKSICAVDDGADFDLMKKTLFSNPSIGASSFVSSLGIDGEEYRRCLNGQRAARFRSKEKSDIVRIGVPHYPSVYMDGVYYEPKSRDKMLRDIVRKIDEHDARERNELREQCKICE